MSEEQKRKIGEANRGKKRSAEISAKLSMLRKGKKRKSPSIETIEKIRAGNIGKKKRKWTSLEKEIHSERLRILWEERRKNYGPSGRRSK